MRFFSCKVSQRAWVHLHFEPVFCGESELQIYIENNSSKCISPLSELWGEIPDSHHSEVEKLTLAYDFRGFSL